MQAEELRAKLQGVIAFPVTPFKADFSLDVPGLRRNLQSLLQHPVAAVVAAGGTGEMYSLTPAEQLAVTQAAVEEADGRVPVISGTGFNLPIAVQLAQQAAQAGADAILALPPYYPNADECALADYYAAIGAATPENAWLGRPTGVGLSQPRADTLAEPSRRAQTEAADGN